MGAENLNPLDELKSLDAQVDLIDDLAGLKPIFYRLEEIAKANAGDFEVQLVAGDVKQHLINRGVKLRELSGAATQSNPALGATGGVPAAGPPPLPGGASPLSAPPPMPDAPGLCLRGSAALSRVVYRRLAAAPQIDVVGSIRSG